MSATITIRVLHCGSISLAPEAVYGGSAGIAGSVKQSLCHKNERITLPCSVYLIEHPKGRILVDTGLCRYVSPNGQYSRSSAVKEFTPLLESFYHPQVAAGMASVERLGAMGLSPEDIDILLLTHLDPDHTSGLRELKGAKRILIPEDEYFWTCRTVYKLRQPWKLWEDIPSERFFYRGYPMGPHRWAYDLFGDESVMLVNLPGHTDGMCGVILRNNGHSLVLGADAALCRENLTQLSVPGFGFDPGLQRKSLEYLQSLAQEPGCLGILCSHDADIKDGSCYRL